MKLFVARHGQTVWNAQNRVCGVTDVKLTERGIGQAKELSDIIQNYDIDIIISSPLKRAIETSKIVADKNSIPLQIEELLIEQNYGIYEGVDRKNDSFLANKRNFAYKYPEGESMLQVTYRIYGLIDKLKEQYQDKNILIITHGGVCRIIRTYFQDMTNDEFFNYTLENGKLEEYEL
ncbi:MAG: histidine phosphatase family protein [Lachnospiraceae bacterium]|nr:histidine phosphatase family protein [Lachnospiraceae bacterium]